MTLDGINHQRNEGAIYNVHRKLGPLGHRAANNRSCCGAEDGLENKETLYGQLATVKTEVAPVGQPNESAQRISPEHQSETYKPEQKGAEHEVNKVLKQDVSRVLTARESCLTQRKPRLHKEYQHSGQ